MNDYGVGTLRRLHEAQQAHHDDLAVRIPREEWLLGKIEEARAILSEAMGDAAGTDWPDDVRTYIARAAQALEPDTRCGCPTPRRYYPDHVCVG